ncbi:MAG: zinc-binding dehydrogenase [Promethearchaeota archaeon]
MKLRDGSIIKAAVFVDIKKIVYKEDYPKPIPGPDDVIVKTEYCGICGSDITNFKFKMYQVPLIMGHEFTGEVVQIGKAVTGVKIGEKVCGINVSLDLSQGELSGLGIFEDGGFAEYVKVPTKYLFRIPQGTTTKEAVMIESFANAARGTRLSNIGNNQKIVIIGAGNIGLCFLKYLLSERKPKYIAIIEPHSFLRDKAKEFGASEAFPPIMSRMKKFFKENGTPDYVFDCAGNEKTLKMALDLVKKGGTILLEGVYKGNVMIPMFLINSKEVCIKGVLGHDREDIFNSINFFAQKKVDAGEFITKIVQLEKTQEAFEKFTNQEDRNFIKMVIKF